MMLTFGVLISLIFAFAHNPEGRNDFNPGTLNEDFFIVLASILVLGWAWDIAWILLQKLRWDRDWPPAFQWGTAFIEGVLVWLLLDNGLLPFIPEEEAPSIAVFLFHYLSIFFVTFAWVQGPMRAMYPHWRFYGGRIV